MSADLIVFGEDWGAHPSSTQHLVRHMPGTRQVVWANSIGLRRPRLDAADLTRALRKLGRTFGPRHTDAAQGTDAGAPTIVQPLVLPMAQGGLARALNRRLLAHRMRPAIRTARLHRPVLWASLPSAVDAVGMLGEAAVVYYCGDDFGALAGVDHDRATAMEAELADRADLILAASETLARRFPAHKTRLLPHGVDHALFATPTPRAVDLPDDRPVAGYYGAIAPWLDQEAIAAAARALPDWIFVLVGPVLTDVRVLRAVPNIRLLGPRPHHALPGYAQHWTAGLVPFRDTAQIRAANPLKLREYLAAGRPVVATDFPALAPYRPHVTVVAPQDLAAGLRRAQADAPDAVAVRQSLVAGESWHARAQEAATLIDRLVA